jgi:isocitrate/isopropylmalate dehydrogenase
MIHASLQDRPLGVTRPARENKESTLATTLLVLEGDGIGPEISRATVEVLQAADRLYGLDLRYEYADIGLKPLAETGTTFPDGVLVKARAADGVVLGPVSHNQYPPVTQGGINPSGALRKQLDLYANIRPARTRGGFTAHSSKPVDLVMVRENTEGFYADRNMFMGNGEFMPTPDVALSVRKVTRQASLRIAEAAFELAMKRRRQVAVVHKANVLRISDGLFLECTREVAQRYPEVECQEFIVDAMAALLVRDPSRFDVIVTTNMFGDILSDEAAELSGSLGLAASLNAGTEHGVAQAQHGSAPDIAGQGVANPASLIGSAAMLLDWLARRGHGQAFERAGAAIEQALDATIATPEGRTRDMGGSLGTQAFTALVCQHLERLAP